MAKVKSNIDSVKDDEDGVKDKDSGVETHGSDEASPPDYDIEMKKWRCARLELLCEQLEIDNRESAHERQQRRKIGAWVAWTAGIVPLVALVILFGMMFACPRYFFSEMNFAVLIFVSFSSMVVIYAFLIRGMFSSIQKNDTHPVADEAIKVARSAIAGKE